MPKNIDIVQILSYGTIGLGFFMALFSYWLILKEQKVKPEPRKLMLSTIQRFMIYSLVLCVIGGVFKYLDEKLKASPILVQQNGRIKVKLISSKFIKDTSVGDIEKTCKDIQKILDQQAAKNLESCFDISMTQKISLEYQLKFSDKSGYPKDAIFSTIYDPKNNPYSDEMIECVRKTLIGIKFPEPKFEGEIPTPDRSETTSLDFLSSIKYGYGLIINIQVLPTFN